MAINPMIANPMIANPVGAMAQGAQYAGIIGDAKRKNQLAQLYQQQGPGILAGDVNSLRALAQYDPAAAQQYQMNSNAIRDSDAAFERRGVIQGREDEQWRMKVEEYKRGISAEQAAAEAAKIKQGILVASGAQSPEQWDQIATQLGQPELIGQFANKDILLRRYMTVAEVLEADAEPKPADEYGRYFAEERAAGRDPLSRIDYAQAKKGTETVFGPDGNPILVRGPGNAPPKLTVDAAKSTGFLIRTRDAHKTINELEEQGTDFLQQAADSLPMGTGNYLRTPEFQRFDQARRDFVNAILRRESGAVISDAEFDNANKQYFPVPGDGPEVIAQKRQNRENAIRGLEVGSGDGAAYVNQQESRQTTVDEGAAGEIAVPAEWPVDPAAWMVMTPEEQQEWLALKGMVGQ